MINMEGMIMEKEIQKMIFVYNSILNGWTVKKLENNKFEFTKGYDDDKQREEINLESYLKNFIKYNLDINNISKKQNGKN